MNGTNRWWQQESAYFLNETLAFINSSRTRDEAIGRCEELCKAMNKTWNAFFQFEEDCAVGLHRPQQHRTFREDASRTGPRQPSLNEIVWFPN